MRVYVDVRLVPKYIALDEERMCMLSWEVLQNGFEITSIAKEETDDEYDSGQSFFGHSGDIDDNIMVNLDALCAVSDKARELIERENKKEEK